MEGIILKIYTLRAIEALLIVALLLIGATFAYFYCNDNIKNVIIFGGSGLVVMVYYFFEFWMHIENRPRLLDYMVFNNPAHTYEAVKRLVILCAGAGVLDHMSAMTLEQIITAGASCGYLAFKTHSKESK